MEAILIFFKIFLFVEISFLVIFISINIYGFILGNKSVFVYNNTYFQNPKIISDALLNVANYTEWVPDLKSIIQDKNSSAWVEIFSNQNKFKNSLIDTVENQEISFQLSSEKMDLVIQRTFTFGKEADLTLIHFEDKFYYQKAYLRTLVHLFYRHKESMRAYMNNLEEFLEKSNAQNY